MEVLQVLLSSLIIKVQHTRRSNGNFIFQLDREED